MLRRTSTRTRLFMLLAISSVAHGQPLESIVPVMKGMRRVKKVPLLESLQKAELCPPAKMGPEFTAEMENDKGSEYRVYKTVKSVSEVMQHYTEFAQNSGMPLKRLCGLN